MKKGLWVVLFLLLTILLLLFLPDGIFNIFVSQNIEISGDGEVAMNNFETAIILIKLGVSAVIAMVLITIVKRVMRKR
ncbi:Uncharacterised protein [Serratia quinivorans]|jgi:hypothetical protein|uniref:hypothetical protein n=1 Tax=Serratia quinivorans TaxID=137545 RepID=UPI00217A4169|nr:hypothetical protein [Serratia quinivorans]CAI0718230.1 Uncharacterised protein [Serratia quinivorans]CAI1557843.1 Uncharacterised protein [Serratia quinivorans]CAI1658989.1 Uncharacterised protein [Serratia quinivorans]CAI2036186.1 Uncharacterised protein [Serratia quinivorans]CAI2131635.1 Uncharacterised protein [Serratia quinivorans]